jgi:hypothetical protein
LLKHHGFPGQIVTAVEGLDIDGMSSEDSEGELGTRRLFRIKKLPWRSDKLGTWFHRIDALPLKNAHDSVLTRRVEHRQRLTSDRISDKRSPPHGLPINLYNQDWLRGRDSRFLKRLGIKNDNLNLPTIDEYTPSIHKVTNYPFLEQELANTF